MGFKIVIADSNANFMSMLGRALLDSDYALYPAESKETALKQLEHRFITPTLGYLNHLVFYPRSL